MPVAFMRAVSTRHWPSVGVALAAALLAWWSLPPVPRLVIRPLVVSRPPPWEKLYFSNDGDLLAVYQPYNASFGRRKIRLWDIRKGEELGLLHDGPEQLEWLALAPDKRHVAFWWFDRTVEVRDRRDGRQVARYQRDDNWWSHVPILYWPDGRLLLYGPHITSGKLWNVVSGRLVADMGTEASGCTSMTTSCPGFIAGSNDEKIVIWDLQTAKQAAAAPHGGQVSAVSKGADGALHIVYRPVEFQQQRRYKVYHSATGHVDVLPRSDDWVVLDISLDGRTLAMMIYVPGGSMMNKFLARLGLGRGGETTYRVEFVDAASGRVVYSMNDAARVRFAPDHRTVAIVGNDSTIYLYDWPLPTPWLGSAGVGLAAGLLTALVRAGALFWRGRKRPATSPPVTG